MKIVYTFHTEFSQTYEISLRLTFYYCLKIFTYDQVITNPFFSF